MGIFGPDPEYKHLRAMYPAGDYRRIHVDPMMGNLDGGAGQMGIHKLVSEEEGRFYSSGLYDELRHLFLEQCIEIGNSVVGTGWTNG